VDSSLADVLNHHTPSDTTKDTAHVGRGNHGFVRRVVDEVEPEAVVDARLFGLRGVAEGGAESSEFGQQHVDVSRAEAIWCIEACKLAG
jgi:poly(3-hydroxybutyrate) depolymerase